VCLSTLGPGATNLVTGVADANLDMAPLVAISGQASTTRLHKTSHQVINLVELFEPITKYSQQVHTPEIIPEVVRKAFGMAEAETSGACFIELPHNVAEMDLPETEPLHRLTALAPFPNPAEVANASALIEASEYPLIMAGHGVIRAGASAALVEFAEAMNIPVVTTFMAKGVIPASHSLFLGTAGLQAHDYSFCGFEQADLIICVGYDMVEYHPYLWRREGHRLLHIHATPAEVDGHYIVSGAIVGDVEAALAALTDRCKSHKERVSGSPRRKLLSEIEERAADHSFPILPQKIVHDLRAALAPDDIVICDVGAHKMWLARLFQAERPNTCIISNGFAAMGIAVPGAVAASLIYPERTVVAVTGDAGFLLNSQELETAVRLGLNFVVLIWNDSSYGLIEWKQMCQLGRSSCVRFGNPDFVQYARSFGAEAFRVEQADGLENILRKAVIRKGVTVIDCPVDYRENLLLTERLGALVCTD
ncbi:MAG TPA: acetolactate synthase large subunit, partial [Thermoleophilia bacterium]|nr:acetolactate synthase large subunit [Thermoleophilia bacterium]